MLKLYCYVDESGQDTEGRLFIVGVVITTQERDELAALCEQIEREVGKQNKWSRTKDTINLAYMQQILALLPSSMWLRYVIFNHITDYLTATVESIAQALASIDDLANIQVTVLYDGLPPSLEKRVGSQLRTYGVIVRKVRGIREEHDPLARLVDAICGLVRDANIGKSAAAQLLNNAEKIGALRSVSK